MDDGGGTNGGRDATAAARRAASPLGATSDSRRILIPSSSRPAVDAIASQPVSTLDDLAPALAVQRSG